MFIAMFLGLTAWAFTLAAHANGPAESAPLEEASSAHGYVVRNGDTLGALAIEFDTTVSELIEANDIEDPDALYAGQEIQVPGGADLPKGARKKRKGPMGVTIEIPRGFPLSRIAATYDIRLSSIVKANRIDDPNKVRAGRKIFIPGAAEVIELVPPPPCYNEPVTIYRVRTDETLEVPLTYCSGKPNPKAVEAISELSGPVRREMPFPLHPRLMQLLQRVADKYPGKRIEIISGQRTSKQPNHESYHNKGQALDYRVAGVPNKQLASFVRRFDNVGVGFYPNSMFIHMDTRERNAWWIDYSGPGEKAIYGRAGMSRAEVEAIRSRREARARKRAEASEQAATPTRDTAKETKSESTKREHQVAELTASSTSDSPAAQAPSPVRTPAQEKRVKATDAAKPTDEDPMSDEAIQAKIVEQIAERLLPAADAS